MFMRGALNRRHWILDVLTKEFVAKKGFTTESRRTRRFTEKKVFNRREHGDHGEKRDGRI
jgi:hypothetical protein